MSQQTPSATLDTFLMPLVNTPQQFNIDLAGTTYQFTCKWNNAADGGWVFDIADALGNPMACNLPLITGDNILDGLDYLGINGSLFVLTNGSSPTDVPTFSNLGIDSNVYLQTSSTDE